MQNSSALPDRRQKSISQRSLYFIIAIAFLLRVGYIALRLWRMHSWSIDPGDLASEMTHARQARAGRSLLPRSSHSRTASHFRALRHRLDRQLSPARRPAITPKLPYWLRQLSEIAAALLALTGTVILLKRRNPNVWPIAAFPVVYYLTVAAEIYRHPIDPTVIVLALVPFRLLPSASNPVAE
jgi:hypothetical protein